MTPQLVKELPDRFICRNEAGEYLVPKKGLSPNMLSRIRGFAKGGVVPKYADGAVVPEPDDVESPETPDEPDAPANIDTSAMEQQNVQTPAPDPKSVARADEEAAHTDAEDAYLANPDKTTRAAVEATRLHPDVALHAKAVGTAIGVMDLTPEQKGAAVATAAQAAHDEASKRLSNTKSQGVYNEPAPNPPTAQAPVQVSAPAAGNDFAAAQAAASDAAQAYQQNPNAQTLNALVKAGQATEAARPVKTPAQPTNFGGPATDAQNRQQTATVQAGQAVAGSQLAEGRVSQEVGNTEAARVARVRQQYDDRIKYQTAWAQSIANRQVDPKRWWNGDVQHDANGNVITDPNTGKPLRKGGLDIGGKILAGIGMFLGGADATRVINEGIDKDIAAQRDNIQNEDNQLKHYIEQTNDLAAAEHLFKADAFVAAAEQLKAAGAPYQSQKTQADTAAGVAKLQNEANESNQKYVGRLIDMDKAAAEAAKAGQSVGIKKGFGISTGSYLPSSLRPQTPQTPRTSSPMKSPGFSSDWNKAYEGHVVHPADMAATPDEDVQTIAKGLAPIPGAEQDPNGNLPYAKLKIPGTANKVEDLGQRFNNLGTQIAEGREFLALKNAKNRPGVGSNVVEWFHKQFPDAVTVTTPTAVANAVEAHINGALAAMETNPTPTGKEETGRKTSPDLSAAFSSGQAEALIRRAEDWGKGQFLSQWKGLTSTRINELGLEKAFGVPFYARGKAAGTQAKPAAPTANTNDWRSRAVPVKQ